jgi:ABC-2 type transport system permease protein
MSDLTARTGARPGRLRVTLATARRVAAQLRRDPPTLALLLAVPPGLIALVRYLFDPAVFDRLGAALLGVVPFVVMFAVTAVAMLRERTTGTLERLMVTPAGRLDLLAGYALTFGAVALVQAGVLVAVATGPLDLELARGAGLLLTVAVLNGLLGMALGLCLSTVARTEFQVGQLMPAFVLPQLLLSGLFGPRDDMATPLRLVSDVLPLTYAVHLGQHLALGTGGQTARDLTVLTAATAAALALAAATLRRRTA